MPNVTVTSLKRENDSLKEEIVTLRRGFENLQKSLTRNDAQESGNGGEPSFSRQRFFRLPLVIYHFLTSANAQ